MGVRPRRKSRVVFWIFMLAIVAGIIATALLANDKRNLRELIQRYKITWIKLDGLMPQKQVAVARRGNRLLPSAATLPTRLPRSAFVNFKTPPSDFMRHWQVSGEQLCSSFGKAGLDVQPWHQGDLYSSTYECSAQIEAKSAGSADEASLFLLVRGTPTGKVSSVRIKVILPETNEGKALQIKFNLAVDILFRESHWVELGTILEQIQGLQNVKLSAFGTRLVFAHEFMDPRRFNLILDLYASSPAQRSTAAYFDKSKWMTIAPLPEN